MLQYFHKVTKEDVDNSNVDTALLFLKLKVTSKAEQKVLTDLELTFKGMSDANSLTIASYELQLMKGNTGMIYEDIYLYCNYFVPSVSINTKIPSLEKNILKNC